MKILLSFIFSLVLFGCAEVSYPNDPNYSNNTTDYTINNGTSPVIQSCRLNVKDMFKSYSSYYILFEDNRNNKKESVNYKIMCGSYRNYSSFYPMFNSGLEKEDIRFTSGCNGSNNICIEIDAIEDCPARTICLNQFN